MPETFRAIGEFYEDFSQVADEEVNALLRLNSEQCGHEIGSAPAGICKSVYP
jgi:predicted phosphoribosyltransferase